MFYFSELTHTWSHAVFYSLLTVAPEIILKCAVFGFQDLNVLRRLLIHSIPTKLNPVQTGPEIHGTPTYLKGVPWIFTDMLPSRKNKLIFNCVYAYVRVCMRFVICDACEEILTLPAVLMPSVCQLGGMKTHTCTHAHCPWPAIPPWATPHISMS